MKEGDGRKKLQNFKKKLGLLIKSSNKDSAIVNKSISYKFSSNRRVPEHQSIFESEKNKEEEISIIKKIAESKSERDYWYRLANSNEYFIDDLKKYLLRVNNQLVNYISERVASEKSIKGYALWGAMRVYLAFRPLAMPFVKNASLLINKGEVKKNVNDNSLVLREILELDGKIVSAYKKVKVKNRKHSSMIKDILHRNKIFFSSPFTAKNLVTASGVDYKLIRFRQNIVDNFAATNKKLEALNKKSVHINNSSLQQLSELLTSLENERTPKKFAENVSSYLLAINSVLELSAKKIGKNNDVTSQDYKIFQILKGTLDKTIKNYEVYRPTCAKYRVCNYFENAIYKFTTHLLKFHKVLFFFPKVHAIAQKVVLKKLAKLATNKAGLKTDSMLGIILNKTASTFLTKINKKVDKYLRSEMEKVLQLYAPVLENYKSEIKNISKIKKEISEAYKVASKRKTKTNKNSYLAFVNDTFVKQENDILKQEFKSYKKLMLKNFDKLYKDLNLNNRNRVNSAPVLVKMEVTLNVISKILKSCNSFDEFANEKAAWGEGSDRIEMPKAELLVKGMQSFSKYMLENRKSFHGFSAKDSKKFIEKWNQCMAKTTVASYYIKLKVANRHLSSLYLIYNFLGEKTRDAKSSIKISFNNNLSQVTKQITKLKKKIYKRLEVLRNISSSIKNNIKNKIHSIENPHIKKVFIVIDTVSKAILDVTACVSSVASTVLKVILPKVGTILGTMGGGGIARLLEGTIPGLAGTEILGTVGDTIGGVVGNCAGSLGASLYGGIDNHIQSASSSKKYNKQLLNKLTSWYETHFPKKEDKLADPYEEIREFRKTCLSVAKVIRTEIIRPLKKSDKNNQRIKELDGKWQLLIKNLQYDNPVKFSAAIKELNDGFEYLKASLDIELSAKGTKGRADSLVALAAKFANSDEVVFKLNASGDEFFKAKNRFDKAKGKFLQDTKVTNKTKKLLTSGVLGNSFLHSIKKIERNVLYTVCTVNYVLIPVAKFVLPIACGIAGYIGGATLGAAGDVAAFGSTVGILSLAGGALGAVLASTTARALVGGYGRLDKKFRQRLNTLDKELAIYTAFSLEKLENQAAKKQDIKQSKSIRVRNDMLFEKPIKKPKIRKKTELGTETKDLSHKKTTKNLTSRKKNRTTSGKRNLLFTKKRKKVKTYKAKRPRKKRVKISKD